MKSEERRSRETSQQHYAKRGISWHGFMLLYYKYETETLMDEDGNETTKGLAIKHRVYMDQIVSSENKQDALGCS